MHDLQLEDLARPRLTLKLNPSLEGFKVRHFTSIAEAVQAVCATTNDRLRIAAPLGLGKPVELLNGIYENFVVNPERQLEIYTALSLVPPKASSDVERRFLDPFVDRHFGTGPRLLYAEAMRAGNLPSNIRVHEFYFQAGQYLQRGEAQRSYLSVNYTHAARAISDRGIDCVVQIVSRNPANPSEYSLSCNPDVTLDIADLHRERGINLPIFAVVHPELPFTGGDAIVPETFFAGIVDDPLFKSELFSLPRGQVDSADHVIGYYASELIEDDGTLQIGIGSLSDALVHAAIARHRQNENYLQVLEDLHRDRPLPALVKLHRKPFKVGLYGTSEMIMDGFMHLREAGILTRSIFDEDEKKLRYLHGAFFLGSKPFYQWLRNLSPEDRDGFSMTRVSKVNDLYGDHQLALRRQRKNARFFNTCMKMSVLGGVVSDTLDSGEVVSGVGGQYNFVAMSHELWDSLSVLMLRSTRMSGGKRASNIVLSQPNETIPRHLRDVVITEYGVAKLRGRTDDETIQAMIEISDVEFQEDLIVGAQKTGKLSSKYRPSAAAKRNSPDDLKSIYRKHSKHFPEYPFGSDFTDVELRLIKALGSLRSSSTLGKLKFLASGATTSKAPYQSELERMSLWPAKSMKEKLLQSIITGGLASSDL